ncbi:NAD(P)H-dependent glycerol-3-phosphate dehydrogenase [Candidatus Finniella inopinata]|uniref:Glycerol-3-phosphate dehydrogenase [NAD(P)+] n=1 Tax=Candidatus Finniella inopinata TaxID=1696036 RepID=A0A4Q7DJQ4_9PROT|nr:NAD(P)H-dependent glycerol-3-phosphate dehydrogenase [Candidatus Finniella inopinata]RZI46499.1 NAD(P)-dependent glycerol-3-phosphate dehydrogenase [Candidatus Finniella inopinata]
MSNNKHVVIVGAGAWGTALAMAMARGRHHVTLVPQSEAHAHELINHRVNKTYFPDITLDPKIQVDGDYNILKTADVILWVIPTQYTHSLLSSIKSMIQDHVPFIICSKGIDCTQTPVTRDSLLSSIVSKIIENPVAFLSGPNFAIEVARGLPAAATLAAHSKDLAEYLAGLLSTPLFPLFFHDDMIGVQIAGALKNVIAIASGIISGRELGKNAGAALLSWGLQEMKTLGVAMGARSDTFFSLAGMGDLILTCSSTESRNTSLGVALGQGVPLKEILASRNSVCEGMHTAGAVHNLSKQYQLVMPICETVYQVVQENISVDAAVHILMGAGNS